MMPALFGTGLLGYTSVWRSPETSTARSSVSTYRPGKVQKMTTISTRLLHLKKWALHSLLPRRIEQPKMVFVMGCQRSGTTLMLDLFDADQRTAIYRETSRAFSDLHINPIEEILSDRHERGAEIRVYKPLLDSHRISEFINEIRNLHVIWMYREYQSVTASSNRRFAPGVSIRDLLPIVENQKNNWRNQGISDATRDHVRKLFSERMNGVDAGALFWLVRNRVLLDSWQQLSENVFLCKYEDLISNPERVIATMYEFIGHALPKIIPSDIIKSDALTRGSGVELSPDVDRLCRDVQAQLDNLYSRQMRG